MPVVRLIFPDSECRVLILRRHGGAYEQGRWCLPGGKVDYRDTVEQTVTKELREETSLECTSSTFLFYQDSLSLQPGKMHCINLYYKCRVTGAVTLNDESSEFGWIGQGDLESYRLAFRHDEEVWRYWSSILPE